MLAAIDRFTGLALEDRPTSSTTIERLADIANVTEQASGLLHRLLTFGGEDRSSPRPIGLDDIITNSHAILHRLAGDNVDLILTTTTGTKNIIADPAQIERLLINLAVNACDAMPNGGRLDVETARVRLDEGFDPGQFPRPKPGDYLMLAIADTGIGMDSRTMRQIFLPLFTTKPPGHGAGMGLATTYGIVRQNGGAIQVESTPGEGTVIKVYFPCAGDDNEARSRHARAAGFGDETVLLVDDEASIRMYTSRVLASRGYKVIEADSPAEALRILRQGDTKFDLVVTDIVMPGMNGRELSDRIRSMSPRLPVLFLSGFSHEVVLREGILDGQMRFLKKPFAPNDLVMQVRKMLDDGRS
jgi:CheY-like chemotaxis protein